MPSVMRLSQHSLFSVSKTSSAGGKVSNSWHALTILRQAASPFINFAPI